MQTEFRKRGIAGGLSVDKGMHRFSWDMRHYGQYDADKDVYKGTGPLVSPGNYLLTLTAGNETVSQEIKIDVASAVLNAGTTYEDLKEQESLALQIRDLRSAAEDLEKRLKKAKKENDQIQEIYNQLVTKSGRYEQPMFLDQIRYLYSMLQRADQKPGRDAYERFETLKRWFDEIQKSAKSFSNTDD